MPSRPRTRPSLKLPKSVRWRRAEGRGHEGRMEATLGYFRLDVEPASNALLVRGGRVVGRARREGWLAGVDDGLGDPSLPGVFATAEEAKREAERVARYTLARRPDRERGTPGWAKGAMRPAARRR